MAYEYETEEWRSAMCGMSEMEYAKAGDARHRLPARGDDRSDALDEIGDRR